MRSTVCAVLLVVVAVAPAFGWEAMDADRADMPAAIVPAQAPAAAMPAPPPPPPPGPEPEVEIDDLMMQMGAPPEAAMMMKLLGQADMDPLMMMMLMGMMDGRGMDEDLMGMLFFSKMLQGGTSQPAQPATILNGDMLLIVEDGVVYKIDTGNMSLAGTVIYKQKAAQANPLGALLPLWMMGRAEAHPMPTAQVVTAEPMTEEMEPPAVEPPRPVP